MRKQTMRSWSWIIGVVVALALPGVAGAATAVLDAPSSDGKATHAVKGQRVTFKLPAGWAATRSPMTNAVVRGSYQAQLAGADQASCVIQMDAIGHLRRTRPVVAEGARFWGGGAFVVSERGTEGSLRWYAGRSDGLRVALAWRPAPAALRTRTRRHLVFQMVMRPRSADDAQRCASTLRGQVATLRSAIRSARVVKA
jgi:hypothetical protein